MVVANIKKRYLYAIPILLILVTGIFMVNAAVNKDKKGYHGSDNILVMAYDHLMNLEEAIDDKVFIKKKALKSGVSEIQNPGHNSAEIWVSVNGDEKTFQDAIDSQDLCGNSSYPYSSDLIRGHFASEIDILIDGSEMSLQEAIDSGEFCCTPDCSCADNLCSGENCTDSVCGIECEGIKTPMNGSWSNWSDWDCIWHKYKSCSGRIRTRNRTCTNPAPACGGENCTGESQEIQGAGCFWMYQSSYDKNTEYYKAIGNQYELDITCKNGKVIEISGNCEYGKIYCKEGAEGTSYCKVACTLFAGNNNSIYCFVCKDPEPS